jgi:hypothetical protein
MNTPDKSNSSVMNLAVVVENMLENTLAWTRDKLNARERDLPMERLLEHPRFWDHFKYELASEISLLLAENAQRVEAVYLYDPSGNPDNETSTALPIDPTIHLIVIVSTPSAALETFMDSLNRVLIERLRELPGPLFISRQFIIDVIVISQEDARYNRGSATLLSSIYAPPLKLWERNS